MTAEIITLMENGFADGAMARWRTLYEIYVVAAVLAEFGEDIAQRYVLHQIVESKAAMDLYLKHQKEAGFAPQPQGEVNKVNRDYEEVIARYGSEFRSPYGWAAKYLKLKKPVFSDLERVAQQVASRSYYKMASYNVHATPKGIFFRLGLIESGTELIAGASNVGLSEPGQRTPGILVLMSLLLFGPRWTVDDMVALQVIGKIAQEIPATFDRAEAKLRRDEERHRRAQRKPRAAPKTKLKGRTR